MAPLTVVKNFNVFGDTACTSAPGIFQRSIACRDQNDESIQQEAFYWVQWNMVQRAGARGEELSQLYARRNFLERQPLELVSLGRAEPPMSA